MSGVITLSLPPYRQGTLRTRRHRAFSATTSHVDSGMDLIHEVGCASISRARTKRPRVPCREHSRPVGQYLGLPCYRPSGCQRRGRNYPTGDVAEFDPAHQYHHCPRKLDESWRRIEAWHDSETSSWTGRRPWKRMDFLCRCSHSHPLIPILLFPSSYSHPLTLTTRDVI